MESDLKKFGSKKLDDDSVVLNPKNPFHSTASLSKRPEAPATKQSNQEPLLGPQHSRSDASVPADDQAAAKDEPDLTQAVNKKDDAGHGTPDDQTVKEKQERYAKYSEKALVFAISTFTTYAISASTTRNTIFIVATAAFFVAISADLFSWKMKPKWGHALVYLSSFNLVLMTFFIFVSFNKDYGYTILALPLIIGAALIHYYMLMNEEERNESIKNTNYEKDSKELEKIFDITSLILNGGGLISAIIVIIRRFISGPDKLKLVAVCSIGFLFFFTVLLGIYLLLVTTVRTESLTLHASYLYILLTVVLVSTLIVTLVTFIRM